MSTVSLEEPVVQIGRASSITIDNDFEPYLESHLNREDVMWERSVGQYTVRMIAEHPSYLELDWLHTKAEIMEPTGRGEDFQVRILESARYDQDYVENHGPREIIQAINADRQEMKRIIKSYMGLRKRPRVFIATAEVRHDAIGHLATNDLPLGQCVYDTYEDFVYGPYGQEIFGSALHHARQKMASLKKEVCEQAS